MFDDPVVPQVSRSSSTEEGGFPVVPRYADTLLPSMGNGGKKDVSGEARDESGKWTADPNKPKLDPVIKNNIPSNVDHLLGIGKSTDEIVEMFQKGFKSKNQDDLIKSEIEKYISDKQKAELEQDNEDEEAAESAGETDTPAVVPSEEPQAYGKDQAWLEENLGMLKDEGMSKSHAKEQLKKFFPQISKEDFEDFIDKKWDDPDNTGAEEAAPVVPDAETTESSKPYYIKKNDKSSINKSIEDHLANGLSHDEIVDKIQQEWGGKYQEKSLVKAVHQHESVKAQKEESAGVSSKTKIHPDDVNDITDYIDSITAKHHTQKWLMGKMNGKFGDKYPEAVLEKALAATQAVNAGEEHAWPADLTGTDDDLDDQGSDDTDDEPHDYDYDPDEDDKVSEPDEAFYDYVKEDTPESIDESVKTDIDPWSPQVEAEDGTSPKWTPSMFIGPMTLDEGKDVLDNALADGAFDEGDLDEQADYLQDHHGFNEQDAVEMATAYNDFYGKDTPTPAEPEAPSDQGSFTSSDVGTDIEKWRAERMSWSEIMNKLNDEYGMSDDTAADAIHKYKAENPKKPKADPYSTGQKTKLVKDMHLPDADGKDSEATAKKRLAYMRAIHDAYVNGDLTSTDLFDALFRPSYDEKKTNALIKANLASDTDAAYKVADKVKAGAKDGAMFLADMGWSKADVYHLLEKDFPNATPEKVKQQVTKLMPDFVPPEGYTKPEGWKPPFEKGADEPAEAAPAAVETTPAPAPETTTFGPSADGWNTKSDTEYTGSLKKVKDFVATHPEVTGEQLAKGVLSDKNPIKGYNSLKVPFLSDSGADFKTKVKFLHDLGVSKADITTGLKLQHPISPWPSVVQAYGLDDIPEDDAVPAPEGKEEAQPKVGPPWGLMSTNEKWKTLKDSVGGFDKEKLANALTAPWGVGAAHASDVGALVGISPDSLGGLSMNGGSTASLVAHMDDLGIPKDVIKSALQKNLMINPAMAEVLTKQLDKPEDLGYNPKAYTLTPGQSGEKAGYVPAGSDQIMADLGAMSDLSYKDKVKKLMSLYDFTEDQAEAHIKYWNANKPKDEPEADTSAPKVQIGFDPDKPFGSMMVGDIVKTLDPKGELGAPGSSKYKTFQKWLVDNSDKTLGDALQYYNGFMGKKPDGSTNEQAPGKGNFKSLDDWSGMNPAFSKMLDYLEGDSLTDQEKLDAVLGSFTGAGQAVLDKFADDDYDASDLADNIINVDDLGDKTKFLSDLGVPTDKIVAAVEAKHDGLSSAELHQLFKLDELPNSISPTPEEEPAQSWGTTGLSPGQVDKYETLVKHLGEHPEYTPEQVATGLITYTPDEKPPGFPGVGMGLKDKAKFLSALGIKKSVIQDAAYKQYKTNTKAAIDNAFDFDKLPDDADTPKVPGGKPVQPIVESAMSGYALHPAGQTVFNDDADKVMETMKSPYDVIEALMFPWGTGKKHMDTLSTKYGGTASGYEQAVEQMDSSQKLQYMLEHGVTPEDIMGAMSGLLPGATKSSWPFDQGDMAGWNAFNATPLYDLKVEGAGTPPVGQASGPTVNPGTGDDKIGEDDLEKINEWAKKNKIGHANLNAIVMDPMNSSHFGNYVGSLGGAKVQDELAKEINGMSDKAKAKWLLAHGSKNDQVFKAFQQMHPDIKPSELAKQLGLNKPMDVSDPAPSLSLTGNAETHSVDTDNEGLNAVNWYLDNGYTMSKQNLAHALLAPKWSGSTNEKLNAIGAIHPTLYGNSIADYVSYASKNELAQFMFDHGMSPDEITEAFNKYGKPLPQMPTKKSTGPKGLSHEDLDNAIKGWKGDTPSLVHALLDPDHSKGQAAWEKAKVDGLEGVDDAVADGKKFNIAEKTKFMIDQGIPAVDVWNAAADLFHQAPTPALEATLDMKRPPGGVAGYRQPKAEEIEEEVVPGDGKIHDPILDKVWGEHEDGVYNKDKLISTMFKPFGANTWGDNGMKESLQDLGGQKFPYDLDKIDGKKKFQFLKEHGFTDEDLWSGLKKAYNKVPDEHLTQAYGLEKPDKFKTPEDADQATYSHIPVLKAIQKHQKTDDKYSPDKLADLVLKPKGDIAQKLVDSAAQHPFSSGYQIVDHLNALDKPEKAEFLLHNGVPPETLWQSLKKAHPGASEKAIAKGYKIATLGPPEKAEKPTFETELKSADEAPPPNEPFGPMSAKETSSGDDDAKATKLLQHAYKQVNSAAGITDPYSQTFGQPQKDLYKAVMNPDSDFGKQYWEQHWSDFQKYSQDHTGSAYDSYYDPKKLHDMSLDEFKAQLKKFPVESKGIALNSMVYLSPDQKAAALQDAYPGMTASYAKKWLGLGYYGGYTPYQPELASDGVPKIVHKWAKHFIENEKAPAQKKFVDYLFKPNNAAALKEDNPVNVLGKAGGVDNSSQSELVKCAKVTDKETLAKWLLSKGFDNNAVYQGYKKYNNTDPEIIEAHVPSLVAPTKHEDKMEPGATYESPLTQTHPYNPYEDDGGSSGFSEYAKPVIPDYHTIEPTETEDEKNKPHYGEAAHSYFNSHWEKNRLRKPTAEEANAWDSYKGSGAASEINPALRNFYKNGTPISSGTKKKIKAMNRMFENYTTPHSFNVMRGSGNNHGAFPDENLEGKTVSLAGFTSCSFAQSTALSFKGSGKTVLLDIHVPKGMHVIPGVGSESEMILPNMTQLYVQKEEQKGNTKCLKCVAIPPKAEDAKKVSRRRIALATLMQTASTSPILLSM